MLLTVYSPSTIGPWSASPTGIPRRGRSRQPPVPPASSLSKAPPGTQAQLRIVSLRTWGPGLAGRSQSRIQGTLGAAGSEAAWKRTRAGANAECRERKQERREPRRARRRAGSGEEGRRPPPNVLSSQGFFRLPIDHGPGRCIIHAGGNEAGPRAKDAEPGQNENEAGGSD